jgi:hypothetical protein
MLGREDYPTAMRQQSRAATTAMMPLAPQVTRPPEAIPEIPELPDGPHLAHRYAKAVAAAHGMTFAEMRSRRRNMRIIHARWQAMFVLSERTPLSLPAIGQMLGGFDHASVLYGIERHKERVGLPHKPKRRQIRIPRQMKLLRVIEKVVAFNETLWRAHNA